MTPTITLIAAMDQNRVIGSDGDLPWHYPEDLAHFENTTMGHPVIMGRVTYESIVRQTGEPLSGRENIVLTTGTLETHADADNVYTAGSIETALETAVECQMGTATDTIYIAGGDSIYKQFLPRADRMVLTEIHDTYEGDAYFPEWDTDRWEEIDRTTKDELSFVTYVSCS